MKFSASPAKLFIGIYVMIACACTEAHETPNLGTQTSELNGATSCQITPITFGTYVSGLPDDGANDLPAIQATLDNKGCVDLGPGVFDIDVAAYVTPGIQINLATGRTLRGVGPQTVLRGRGAIAAGGDYHLLHVAGDNVAIGDLTVDLSGLTNTQVQNHAIYVNGPAKHVSITNTWLINGLNPGETNTGDCIFVFGNTGNVEDLIIAHNHFVKCFRTGVATQSRVYGMMIESNIFYDCGQQDIDAEMTNVPTLGGAWEIRGNIVFTPTTPQGTTSIAVSGSDLQRVVISDNIIWGRGIRVFNAAGAVVSNNVIMKSVGGQAEAVLSIERGSKEVTVANNRLWRTSSAASGSVLTILTSNGTPSRVAVTGNVITQDTSGASQVELNVGVDLSGAQEVVVTGNNIAIVDSRAWGLRVQGTANAVATLINGNLFKGGAAAVEVNGGYLGLGAFSVVGNLATGTAHGLQCDNVTTTLVSSGNNWPAPTSSCTTLSTGQ